MINPKLHVDLQWLNKISMNLARFKKTRNDVYNCVCPFCGDPKKRDMKFYFFCKKGSLFSYCHKCLYSRSFFMFMKEKFFVHFDEYKRETLFDSFTRPSHPSLSKQKNESNTLAHVSTETLVEKLLNVDELKEILPKLTDLPKDHIAVEYMVSRGFDDSQLARLYYAENFKSFASRINEESCADIQSNESRIVIPFISENGFIEMVQGRALTDSKVKYLSVKAHDDIDKIYGKYELDETMISYCVEGPLDALFVDNCIATCDANLSRSGADVLIWDNQCRNKQIITAMERAIDSGFSVVVWPTSTNTKQDINDMIKAGVTRAMLMEVIRKCTFNGLMAKAQLMRWRRM